MSSFAQSITLKLSLETEASLEALARSLSREELIPLLMKVMNKQAQIAAGHIIKTQFGSTIKSRSGQLAQSIVGARNVMVEGIPAARVGVFKGQALNYAGVQEFGTVARNPFSPFPSITPKKARALAFAPEGSPANAGAHRLVSSPRRWTDPLTFLPIRKGKVVGRLVSANELAQVRLGNLDFSAIQTVFLLMSKVDLMPRKYLLKGFTSFLPKMERNISNAIVGLFKS